MNKLIFFIIIIIIIIRPFHTLYEKDYRIYSWINKSY